jgi:hypothetical protein
MQFTLSSVAGVGVSTMKKMTIAEVRISGRALSSGIGLTRRASCQVTNFVIIAVS